MVTPKSSDNDKDQYVKSISSVDFAIFSSNHIELWPIIKGAIIHHSTWGAGKIIRIEQRLGYIPLIYVLFENNKEEKTFNSDSFKSSVIEAINISEAQNEALQSWKKQYTPISQPMRADKHPCFSDFGVNSLWHMTHNENIITILDRGILNHCDANQFNRVDISDPDTQKWRQRTEPCFGRKIHEYAPLYINPRNPMMYVRKHLQSKLCLLEISLSVLSENEYLIADGNAASRDTKFYDSMSSLNLLPWDVLRSDSWSDKEGGKRKRCAEILVFPRIESKYIKSLHFYNHIPSFDGVDKPMHITPKLYF